MVSWCIYRFLCEQGLFKYVSWHGENEVSHTSHIIPHMLHLTSKLYFFERKPDTSIHVKAHYVVYHPNYSTKFSTNLQTILAKIWFLSQSSCAHSFVRFTRKVLAYQDSLLILYFWRQKEKLFINLYTSLLQPHRATCHICRDSWERERKRKRERERRQEIEMRLYYEETRLQIVG